MKLEKALSKELNRLVTAHEADIECEKKNIKSKFLFECPDEDCHADVTCANLTKAKDERCVEPYFIYVSKDDCIDGCTIKKDLETKKKTGAYNENELYTENDRIIADTVRIDISLPDNKKRTTSSENDTDADEQSTDAEVREKRSQTKKKTKQLSRVVSSLVSDFLAGEDYPVHVPRVGAINLQAFFIEIGDQDINALGDECRIYYGKGWFNVNIDDGPNSTYYVRFDNMLQCNDIEVKPKVFINKVHIENYPYKKFRAGELKKLATKIPKDIYVLATRGPVLKKEQYINIELEGLQCLDYRER